MRYKAEHLLKAAPTFQVDLDIDELMNNSLTNLQLQQDICDKDLGNDKQAQVFSAQWVDRNGKKIAFYLAKRWAGDLVPTEASKF